MDDDLIDICVGMEWCVRVRVKGEYYAIRGGGIFGNILRHIIRTCVMVTVLIILLSSLLRGAPPPSCTVFTHVDACCRSLRLAKMRLLELE